MAFIKVTGQVQGGSISRNTVIGKNPKLLDVEGTLKDVAIDDNTGIPPELWSAMLADRKAGMGRAAMAAKWTGRLLAVGANVATIWGLLFRN